MSGDRIVIGTSIAPRGLEKQRDAVESWRALGFEVISLNIPNDIAVLQSAFPGVRFVPAYRTAEAITGRPLVYFDDLLTALSAEECGVVGIINSDVMLRGPARIRPFLAREAADAFLIGSRLDVVNFEEENARVYAQGYDFFLFDSAVTGAYPRTELCLGMPWWDYWAPLAAQMRGFPVKRLETPLVYHPHHETAWDKDQWVRFGVMFASSMHTMIQSATETRRMADNSSAAERWLMLGGELAHETHLRLGAEFKMLEDRYAEAERDGTPEELVRLKAMHDQLVGWYCGICTFVNRSVSQRAQTVSLPAEVSADGG